MGHQDAKTDGVEPMVGDNAAPRIGDRMPDDPRRGMSCEERIEQGMRVVDASQQLIAGEPQIGAVMRDGTIYAGISPDTGKPMYATPGDAPLSMTFNQAAGYANKLNREKHFGHNDWRVPSIEELGVLFNNRSAIGGFNAKDYYVDADDCYWSASLNAKRWYAFTLKFGNGEEGTGLMNGRSRNSLRLIR